MINILYELPGYEIMEHAGTLLRAVIQQLLDDYAVRSAYGEKNQVQQYKIYVLRKE